MNPTVLQNIEHMLNHRERCLKELEARGQALEDEINVKLANGQDEDEEDVKRYMELAREAEELRIAAEEDRKYLDFVQHEDLS